MAAFFHSRGVLCHISEWRRFFIAGVFSAIYPSGGVFSLQGCSLPYIRVAAFFHCRGGLYHVSEWRRFFIAGEFSAIYPSGGVFSQQGCSLLYI